MSPAKTDEPIEMQSGADSCAPRERRVGSGCVMAPPGKYNGSICAAAATPFNCRYHYRSNYVYIAQLLMGGTLGCDIYIGRSAATDLSAAIARESGADSNIDRPMQLVTPCGHRITIELLRHCSDRPVM